MGCWASNETCQYEALVWKRGGKGHALACQVMEELTFRCGRGDKMKHWTGGATGRVLELIHGDSSSVLLRPVLRHCLQHFLETELLISL